MVAEKRSPTDLIAALRGFGREQLGKDGLTISAILDQLRSSSGILTDHDIEILKIALNNFLYSKNKDYVISDDLFQKCVKALDLEEKKAQKGAEFQGSSSTPSTPFQEERDLRVEPIKEKKVNQIPRTRFDNYSILGLLGLASLLVLVKFTLVTSHQSFDSFDGVDFLIGGAYYAGLPSYGAYYGANYAPGMRVLLSLMFRITGPSTLDGWILSAVLFLVSMIACYLISRQIMNPWIAILASISFGISPQVFQFAGVIMSNVEGVAIAAISFAALVLAIKINKKMFLFAFPLMAIAALTRFTLGAIIVPATIYLLMERKKAKAASRYVLGGVLLLVFTAIIFGFQWFAWPLIHHQSLGILIPPPMNYRSPYGQLVYAVNFPEDLALGIYGYILTALFICSLIYTLFHVLRGRFSKINPTLYAMIAWFAILFLFYSLLWRSQETRYALEFAMPAIILACWFLSVLFESLYSFVKRQKNLRLVGSAIFMVAIVVCVSYSAVLSSAAVLQDVPYSYCYPSWGEINTGMSQAATWLRQNVPPNVVLGSNMFNELFWYAPQYKVKPFLPSDNYSSLKLELSQQHVGYLVLCPLCNKQFLSLNNNATALSFLDLRSVWISNTTYAVQIFKVSNQ